MFKARVNTIRVPLIFGPPVAGANQPTPAVIVQQAPCNCVVRIRNNSFGDYILVAYDQATLMTFPAKADTWRVPAGAVDEFIVAKGQSLLASTPSGGGDGAGVEISYHVFEALPVDESHQEA